VGISQGGSVVALEAAQEWAIEVGQDSETETNEP